MSDTPALVSVDWLAAHIGDGDVRIVDGTWFLPSDGRSGAEEYRKAHIPGAVYFDIDAIADTSSPLPHMLPSPGAFAEAVGALGIGSDHHVVAYDLLGLFSSPRVWWTFREMGAERISVLDGGLPAWRAAGHAVTDDPASTTPATFIPRPRNTAVSMDDVRGLLADGSAVVVDARSAARFRGHAPEPRPGLRSGHMPGSANVPFDAVLANGHLRAADEIAAVFREAGVDLDRPVVTSCGSGVTAAVLALALDRVGVGNVRLYDGSWTEWGGHPDTPVATVPDS